MGCGGSKHGAASKSVTKPINSKRSGAGLEHPLKAQEPAVTTNDLSTSSVGALQPITKSTNSDTAAPAATHSAPPRCFSTTSSEPQTASPRGKGTRPPPLFSDDGSQPQKDPFEFHRLSPLTPNMFDPVTTPPCMPPADVVAVH
eukprot:m.479545 g.479545  ORF g.479545 m.479545 type:complete len:144 (+) comp49980_c0_seq1:243-674(+)